MIYFLSLCRSRIGPILYGCEEGNCGSSPEVGLEFATAKEFSPIGHKLVNNESISDDSSTEVGGAYFLLQDTGGIEANDTHCLYISSHLKKTRAEKKAKGTAMS